MSTSTDPQKPRPTTTKEVIGGAIFLATVVGILAYVVHRISITE